jgi:hypothetical protein
MAGPKYRKKFSEEIKKRTPKQEKNIAKQKLERIIRQKDKGLSTTGVDPQTSWGKRTGKYNDVRDKYLEGGWDALTEGEKTKAAFYLGLDGAGSVPTPYGGALDRFKKTSPLHKEVYQERFPHPLVQLAAGIKDLYQNVSPTGIMLSGLKKADETLGEVSSKVQTGVANIFDKIKHRKSATEKRKGEGKDWYKAVSGKGPHLTDLKDLQENYTDTKDTIMEDLTGASMPIQHFVEVPDFAKNKAIEDNTENIQRELIDNNEGIQNELIDETMIPNLFIDEYQDRTKWDDETYNKMVGAYYGVPDFEDDLRKTGSSGAPQDTGANNVIPLKEPNAIDISQEFDDTFGFNSANFQKALDEDKKEQEAAIAAGEKPYDFDSSKPGVQTWLERVEDKYKAASELPGGSRDLLRNIILDSNPELEGAKLNTFRSSWGAPSYPVVGPQFPEYEDFQDVETMGPLPLESGIFEKIPFYSGLFDWNFSPERKPETFNTFKDGGGVYDILKNINDTMND